MVMTPRQIEDMLLDQSNKALWLHSTNEGLGSECRRNISSVRDRIELWEFISETSSKFKDSWRF